MSTKSKWHDGRLYYYDSDQNGGLWPAMPGAWSFDDFYGINTTDLVANTDREWFGTAPGTADAVTIAVTASVPGTAKVLSGTADNDHVFLSTELSYYGKFDACFETRLTIDSASAVGLMIGFTDTTGIANAGAMTLAGTTWTTGSVDGAAFVYDTDATTDYIYCMGVKNNTDKTAVSVGSAPVAGTYNIYRVELVDDGTATAAKFYIDGEYITTISDCLTRTTALTPFVSVGCRTGAAAKYALVDYCKAWQKRA